jgi:glycerol-3-phosphate cytidylyltransferase
MKLDYKEKGRVGITFSSFDLLHAGHVTMLEEAKRHCDYLIVGLQTNPQIDRPEKNKPVQSIVERQIQLAGIKYVDEIVTYETESDIIDLLLTLPVSVRIVGEDYKGKEFTGKELCIQQKIKIIYNSRKHSFSTTSLRERLNENSNNGK